MKTSSFCRSIPRVTALLCLACCTALCNPSPIVLPAGEVGLGYSYQIHAEGGIAPLQFILIGGSLPPGLTLDKGSGVISGTPSVAQAQPFLFSVEVQDRSSPAQKAAQRFAARINAPALRVTATALADPATSDAEPSESVSSSEAVVDPGGSKLSGTVAGRPSQLALIKPASSSGETLSAVSDQTPCVTTGTELELTVKLVDGNKKPVSGAMLTADSAGVASADSKNMTTGADGTANFPVKLNSAGKGFVEIKGNSGNAPVFFSITAGDKSCEVPTGDLTRILVGLEQSGASSSASTAKFFFDFYNDRPLGKAPANRLFGSAYRWWGSVRIGTTPVQTTAAISSIASNVTQQAKSLTLNQLAQAGEFQTGFAYQTKHITGGPLQAIDRGLEYSTFGIIAGVGATLPFDPRSAINVFDLPSLTDSSGLINQGRARFNAQFPAYASTTAAQVAFTTPDRNQFFRQYFAGFRLTTLYKEQDSDNNPVNSLGNVSFTLGQNEAITGGKLRGIVAQVEAFFPVPLSVSYKSLSALYLFGRTSFWLDHSSTSTPVLLEPTTPAPTMFGQSLVIANPSRRDLYTLGIGVDAIRFIKGVLKPAKSN